MLYPHAMLCCMVVEFKIRKQKRKKKQINGFDIELMDICQINHESHFSREMNKKTYE